jgi:hypothetical protein
VKALSSSEDPRAGPLLECRTLAGGTYAKRLAAVPDDAEADPSRTPQELRALHLARCIAARPEPDCPNTGGWWAVSESSGLAIPRTCKRWDCDACRRFKRLSVLVALQHGLAIARANGQAVRHLVLTDRDGSLDFASFYDRWSKRLVPRLRRKGFLSEYACALEVQPTSGRLHAHVLLVEPPGASGFIPKDWLDKATADLGLGWPFISLVADIPAVQATLAGYFVKGVTGDYSVPSVAAGTIGSYMAKTHEMASLAGFSNQRLRPFRVSAGWPLKLRAAAEQLRAELYGASGSDAGPWMMVQETRCSAYLSPMREQQRTEAEREARWQDALRLQQLMAAA